MPDIPIPRSRHGRLVALSMMKDEAPYLLEWVAHHLAVGFTHFIVFTNDCTDGTVEMLKRLEALGLATHRENRIAPGKKPQPSALKHAQVDPEVARADWLMVFDADEFLCLTHPGGTLDAVLDDVGAVGANGLVVTWRTFGSAGIERWDDRPVTETFLRAAPKEWNKGWGVKTLFRFDPEVWKLGIHRPKMKNKVLDGPFPDTVAWLNGSGHALEPWFRYRGWRSVARTVGFDWAQMHHYAVKSAEAYALRRLRGNVNAKTDKYNADYFALQDRNEVEDRAADAHAADRARYLAALMGDAELARLHRRAVDEAETRLDALRQTEGYAVLMRQLRVAGEVPLEEVSAAPPKPRDPTRVSAKEGPPAADDVPRAPALYLRHPGKISGTAIWHPNHDVELPADPALFTPMALGLVSAGKFQRGLARHLPSIAADNGPYLEIGAASGFLGLQVARTAPECVVTMTEPDPAWRAALEVVQTRCGAGDLVAETVPDGQVGTLVLGDPALDPEAVAKLIDAHRPEIVLLVGRLLTARQMTLSDYETVLDAAGLTHRLKLDPSLALAGERRE